MINNGRLVHLNKKICQSTKLKEDSLVGLRGIVEKCFDQRNAAILHGTNLDDQRP